MTIYLCNMCHAVIPASRLAARHSTKERLATMLLFCDQQCLVAWRKEHGFYGAISVLPQARERRFLL
jgi:hypothetical protein